MIHRCARIWMAQGRTCWRLGHACNHACKALCLVTRVLVMLTLPLDDAGACDPPPAQHACMHGNHALCAMPCDTTGNPGFCVFMLEAAMAVVALLWQSVAREGGEGRDLGAHAQRARRHAASLQHARDGLGWLLVDEGGGASSLLHGRQAGRLHWPHQVGAGQHHCRTAGCIGPTRSATALRDATRKERHRGSLLSRPHVKTRCRFKLRHRPDE